MVNEFLSLKEGHLAVALLLHPLRELLICIDKDHSPSWRILLLVPE